MNLLKPISTYLIVICCLGNAFSYPIKPRPLRKLIKESEHIVVAKVLKVEKNPVKDSEHWNNTRAILLIREILQGQISADTVKVYFARGMICPSPASYIPNQTVLAFINKNKNGMATLPMLYLMAPNILLNKAWYCTRSESRKCKQSSRSNRLSLVSV